MTRLSDTITPKWNTIENAHAGSVRSGIGAEYGEELCIVAGKRVTSDGKETTYAQQGTAAGLRDSSAGRTTRQREPKAGVWSIFRRTRVASANSASTENMDLPPSALDANRLFARRRVPPIILCFPLGACWETWVQLALPVPGSFAFTHSPLSPDRRLSLQIIHYPHPTLRHPSKPLIRVDAELRKIVAQMLELMYEHEGVGLAANQVDLPYRLFVTNVDGKPETKEAECVFINPVLSRGHGQEEDEEGCLSIPGVYAPVTRNTTVKIQAYDLAGNEITGEFDGLMARILQHETDHLDGTLFIDRLGPTQLAAVRDKLEEFELDFRSRRETGELPEAEQMAARLQELERLRT